MGVRRALLAGVRAAGVEPPVPRCEHEHVGDPQNRARAQQRTGTLRVRRQRGHERPERDDQSQVSTDEITKPSTWLVRLYPRRRAITVGTSRTPATTSSSQRGPIVSARGSARRRPPIAATASMACHRGSAYGAGRGARGRERGWRGGGRARRWGRWSCLVAPATECDPFPTVLPPRASPARPRHRYARLAPRVRRSPRDGPLPGDSG